MKTSIKLEQPFSVFSKSAALRILVDCHIFKRLYIFKVLHELYAIYFPIFLTKTFKKSWISEHIGIPCHKKNKIKQIQKLISTFGIPQEKKCTKCFSGSHCFKKLDSLLAIGKQLIRLKKDVAKHKMSYGLFNRSFELLSKRIVTSTQEKIEWLRKMILKYFF